MHRCDINLEMESGMFGVIKQIISVNEMMTQTVVFNPDKSKPFTTLVNVSNFANAARKGSMKRPQRI